VAPIQNDRSALLALKLLIILLGFNLVAQVIFVCQIVLDVSHTSKLPVTGILLCTLVFIFALIMKREGSSHFVTVLLGSIFSVIIWLFLATLH
jgi:di/tricarboxylate transporter